jgi:hypothetical protein
MSVNVQHDLKAQDDSGHITAGAVVASRAPEESPEVGHESDIEPPDGGLVGWMQVAGSFALYFNHL